LVHRVWATFVHTVLDTFVHAVLPISVQRFPIAFVPWHLAPNAYKTLEKAPKGTPICTKGFVHFCTTHFSNFCTKDFVHFCTKGFAHFCTTHSGQFCTVVWATFVQRFWCRFVHRPGELLYTGLGNFCTPAWELLYTGNSQNKSNFELLIFL